VVVDSKLFDRISKSLAGLSPRRDAAKALAGTGFAAAVARYRIEITGAKKKRKRCRKIGQTCGGKKKCCNKSGLVRCRPFTNIDCDGVDLTGNRCCGLEGAPCDPNFGEPAAGGNPMTAFGNCSCCPGLVSGLFCGKQSDGSFKCQTTDT
jgi:hypothetical protein